MKNTYRIYIKSEKNPRTINTPCNGRTYYEMIPIDGKEAFIAKLNELVEKGKVVREVRFGYGGSYVKYWEYLAK